MPDATIPWIKIKIEALLNLLKDFIIRMSTNKVMWLTDEKAIKDLWSDCNKQNIALNTLPISKNIKAKFSKKGVKNTLNR